MTSDLSTAYTNQRPACGGLYTAPQTPHADMYIAPQTSQAGRWYKSIYLCLNI